MVKKSVLKTTRFIVTLAFVGLFLLLFKFIIPQTSNTTNIVSQVVYADQSMNSSTWYENFTYVLDDTEHIITLNKYIGEETDITIKSSATINDQEYIVYIAPELFKGEAVAHSISFEEGVVATDLNEMFAYSNSIETIDLTGLDTTRVTNMGFAFASSDNENYISKISSVNFGGIDTSNVTNMTAMFYFCGKIEEIDMRGLDTSKVTSADLAFLCIDNEKYIEIKAQGIDDDEAALTMSMSSLKRVNLSGLNFENLNLSINGLFAYCTDLESVDLSNVNAPKLSSLLKMFMFCHSLENVNFTGFNAPNVTSMEEMFAGCTSLTSIDLSKLSTSKVTTMESMFAFCSSLTSIDLKVVDFSSMTTIRGMFQGCCSLEEVDMSGIIANNLTNMNETFSCYDYFLVMDLLNQGLVSSEEELSQYDLCALSAVNFSGFQANNLRSIEMFVGCTSLQSVDFSSFSFANVDYSGNIKIFNLCPKLSSVTMPSALPESEETIINLPYTFYLVSDGYQTSATTLNAFAGYLSTSQIKQELVRRFTLTFQTNDENWGTVSEESIVYYYGQPIVEKNNILTIGQQEIVATNKDVLGYTTALDEWEGLEETYCEDSIITANFTRTVNEYTLTLIVDGMVYQELTQNYGSPIVAPDMEKEGYTFSGWDQDMPATMPAEDKTLRANYTINHYTMTFVVDGHEYSIITQNYDTKFIAPTAPEKVGYTFIGWGDNVPDTIPSQNITFTAVYQVNQYTLTLIVDGEVYDELTQDYGSNIVVANPTKTGYTFSGWDEILPTTVPAEDKTFTGSFAINQYSLIFKDGNEVIETITQDYNTSISAPDDPEKAGYIFSGWDSIIPSVMPAEDVTINANFILVTYTITYKLDGGKLNGENPTTYTVESDDITLANPTREGYIFNGWYENDEKPNTDYTITKGTTGNKTFTASWTKADDNMPVYIAVSVGGVAVVGVAIGLGIAIAKKKKKRLY